MQTGRLSRWLTFTLCLAQVVHNLLEPPTQTSTLPLTPTFHIGKYASISAQIEQFPACSVEATVGERFSEFYVTVDNLTGGPTSRYQDNSKFHFIIAKENSILAQDMGSRNKPSLNIRVKNDQVNDGDEFVALVLFENKIQVPFCPLFDTHDMLTRKVDFTANLKMNDGVWSKEVSKRFAVSSKSDCIIPMKVISGRIPSDIAQGPKMVRTETGELQHVPARTIGAPPRVLLCKHTFKACFAGTCKHICCKATAPDAPSPLDNSTPQLVPTTCPVVPRQLQEMRAAQKVIHSSRFHKISAGICSKGYRITIRTE